jgi:hypothetical protein
MSTKILYMNDAYLLEQLFKKSSKVRKAQREYYAYKARLDDPMKRSLLQESQRREVDLDRLMAKIGEVKPELLKEEA